jgi:hypothetical protein
MPKRRGRELIRGRFVPRLDFDHRLNLEFHDRGLWRHNHGFKKIHRRPDLCVQLWAPASFIGVSLVNDKCSNHSSGLRLRLLALLEDVVLKYRQLGASELRVPVISLGSWLTTSGGIARWYSAPLLPPGDESLFRDERHRQGAIPRADCQAARRFAEAAWDGLYRSLSMPPL